MTSDSSQRVLEQLADIVGAQHVLVDEASTAGYLTDWRGAFRGRARAVVRPASTEEVAAVVRTCANASIPVVPHGGNTGMCGGAIPDTTGDAIVLALGRMDRALEVDARNDSMTVEAGCVLARVQEAAVAADRMFPLSLAAEGSCQIGGNVATNAGGINVLRFGNARDLVLGVEAVLADGSVWNGLRALRKDNRGYDLKHVFIGSEGTLGVITTVVLKLFPRLRNRVTALVAVADPDAAVSLLSELRSQAADGLIAYELIGRLCLDLVFVHVTGTRDPFERSHPWCVLLDLAGPQPHAALEGTLATILARGAERGEVIDAVIAQNVAHAHDLWRLREAIPDAVRRAGAAWRSDIAVAITAMPKFVRIATAQVTRAIPGARIVCFGHVGDGNLHFNVLPPLHETPADWPRPVDGIVYDLVASMNGSFSAEHGVGQAKRDELARYKDPVEIALMRRVKSALDPMNLMNPGKIL